VVMFLSVIAPDGNQKCNARAVTRTGALVPLRWSAISVASLMVLSACATAPGPGPVPAPQPGPAPSPQQTSVPTPIPQPRGPQPVAVSPSTPPVRQPERPPALPPPPADLIPLRFEPIGFEGVPDWGQTDVSAARRAFVRSCALIQRRPASEPLSNIATYSGRVGDWTGVCRAASDANVADRTFWESNFQAWTLAPPSGTSSRLTAYYEPIMNARRERDQVHSEPIQARPADLLEIDLGAFDPAQRGRTLVGRVSGTSVIPYPPRAQITPQSAPVLAWGEPGEVLNLQIQGSGRLVYPDGQQVRASFAAHNGQPFGSIARDLIRRGILPANGASMDAITDWFRTAEPGISRDVLNANPRTVFFKLSPLSDPSVGPTGGQGLPLEPGGSMAVDTSYHAYGVPLFVSASAPVLGNTPDSTLRRLLITQDTGGAIKGPIRGDLYWGTGPEALMRAGRVNHSVAFWALLPKGMDPAANTKR
jgi:membrane-bound lytic murein transglycosylase A